MYRNNGFVAARATNDPLVSLSHKDASSHVLVAVVVFPDGLSATGWIGKRKSPRMVFRLRSANTAHERWRGRSCNPAGRYVVGRACSRPVRVVCGIPRTSPAA